MKLVDRHELMKMPKGTIYQSLDGGGVGELMVKGDTCVDEELGNVDWYENPLGAYTIADPDPQLELNYDICRNGCFDDDERYIVHEPDDVEIMVAKLQGGGHTVRSGAVLPIPKDD